MTPNPTEDVALSPIPRPPGIPLLGHLPLAFLYGRNGMVQVMMRTAKAQGPIFQLDIPHRNPIFLCGHALVKEILDERRFEKNVSPPLKEVRTFSGDGLFTAYNDEPNWRTAHNVLMPGFGMKSIKTYYPAMLNMAKRLVAHWERSAKQGIAVDVSADMTRLTFDTIGLCGFDQDFGSFERQEPHAFVQAMVEGLRGAMHRLHQPQLMRKLMGAAERRYQSRAGVLHDVVDKVIAERRASGERKADFLDLMLHSEDPRDGRKLDDINIRYQVLTLLIAGHETTSGLLSFALYHLVKHPELLTRLRAEVDEVLGNRWPEFEDIAQLNYTRQVLLETLRLWPTAPAFSRTSKESFVLGGRYKIEAKRNLIVFLAALHRDPEVWGKDAERFDPERFTPEAIKARPSTAFRPFGTGKRACIGRQFALIEATLALAVVVGRFKLHDFDHYKLEIEETLTVKPKDFRLKVTPRTDRPNGPGKNRPEETQKPAAAGCPVHSKP